MNTQNDMEKIRKESLKEIVARIKAHNDSMNLLATYVQNKYGNKKENIHDTRENFEAFSEDNEQQAVLMAGTMGPAIQSKPVSFLDKLRIQREEKAARKAEAELSPDPETETDNAPEPEDIIEVHSSEIVPLTESPIEAFDAKGESFSLNIVLNEKQQAAAELARQGKSFVLTGAAGTGKTTTQRAVAQALLHNDAFSTSTFKYYDISGQRQYGMAPSIAFCAYTRRAARNLQKAIFKLPELADAFALNVMTIHALLEYEPETYWDAIEMKERFRFTPKRTAANPLTITHLVIEEASMLGLDLWEKLYDALPYGVQIIFIGDINQLPPVFGPSILNYALVQLPIIELDIVYRNQGIVLENAHRILNGKMVEENHDYQIIRGKKPVQQPQSVVAKAATAMLNNLIDITGDDGYPEYDPEDCIVLTPFNVDDCGSDNLNNWLAQFIGDRRKAVVHEILAGRNKRYLAVGDKVMFNKRDGIIIDIYKNANYNGKIPQIAGSDLTRFGARRVGHHNVEEINATIAADASKIIPIDYSNFSLEDEKMERKQQASHCVVIRYEDGTEDTIESAGDFSNKIFSLGYVLTVHKAQGSEWRKVFIIFHKEHAVMLYRELLYTAATRARTKVAFICKENAIMKCIENPRIKGNTLADKLEFFNAKLDLTLDVNCVKV